MKYTGLGGFSGSTSLDPDPACTRTEAGGGSRRSWGRRSVEDITIGVTRPGGAGLRHNDHHVKPSTKLEDDDSEMG